MYLVVGSERALLVDAGLGTGDLRGLVEGLIGDRPLDVVITHGHPDHIAAMGQFQDHYDVYMNHRDLPMVQGFVERMGYRIDLEQIVKGAGIDLNHNYTSSTVMKHYQDAKRRLWQGDDPKEVASWLRRMAQSLNSEEDDQTSRTQMDSETLRERVRSGKKKLREIDRRTSPSGLRRPMCSLAWRNSDTSASRNP